jgi:hypothetical protein
VAVDEKDDDGRPRKLWKRVVSFAQKLAGTPLPPPRSTPPARPVTSARTNRETPKLPPEPIRTRTMARLLSSQGHHARALTIYRELAAAAPGDSDLARETAECAERAAVSAGPRRDETRELVFGNDEVVSVRADETSVLVSWEVSERGIARAERLLARPGELTARLVLVVPDAAQVIRTELRERRVERMGEWLVANLPSDARTTASVGLRAGDAFVSIAHCPVLPLATAR